MGFEPKQEIQINSLNKTTRNSLYNLMLKIFPDDIVPHNFVNVWEDIFNKFLSLSRDEAFDIVINLFDENNVRITHVAKAGIKDIFFEKEWHKIFDIMEYFNYRYCRSQIKFSQIKFNQIINQILIDENVGYRFIRGMFVPLTNEEEIAEIAKAMITPYQNANEHIKKATQFFSNRTNPDYENSIKESITAVEAVAKELTGKKNASLGDAIKVLETNGIVLHGAFKVALDKLYGYTSEASGVRHAGSVPLQQDQATARFMLITCSAFVNYIIANAPTKK